MNEFIKFFDEIRDRYGFNLEIYNSSITEWRIKVGYKITMNRPDEIVIEIEGGCDVELAFARAQVALKEWLLENKGGY